MSGLYDHLSLPPAERSVWCGLSTILTDSSTFGYKLPDSTVTSSPTCNKSKSVFAFSDRSRPVLINTMPSARVSNIAERRATRSSSRVNPSDAKPAVDRLQDTIEKEKVPNYIRLLFELLMETRAEIKEMSQRNMDLLTEIQKSACGRCTSWCGA
ncbi:unnamed protein product [Heligmosomoides polygyrus]|uniref:Uncharacterized protein n=1 Tax=Heligmosomoides polygyrus TaxID=6339 RepID=A0A183GV04_HELPZ|nr:unnamed protein product [Heligmosomoides polygyrus]